MLKEQKDREKQGGNTGTVYKTIDEIKQNRNSDICQTGAYCLQIAKFDK